MTNGKKWYAISMYAKFQEFPLWNTGAVARTIPVDGRTNGREENNMCPIRKGAGDIITRSETITCTSSR